VDPILLAGALVGADGGRQGLNAEETFARVAQQMDAVRRANQYGDYLNARTPDQRASLQEAADVALNEPELRLLGLDKYFSTPGGTEYGADQADFKFKTDQDKEIESKARRRLENLAVDQRAEQEAREGIFAADYAVEERKEYNKPKRRKNPRFDSFVVKSEGRPVKFDYSVGEKLQAVLERNPALGRDPEGQFNINFDKVGADGVVKAVMAKRRGAGTQDVYIPSKGTWQKGRMNYGEHFYPSAQADEPKEVISVDAGRSNDQDILQRLDYRIENNLFEKPEDLALAQKIRGRIVERLNPQAGIKREKAEAAKLVAQEREGRTVSELKEKVDSVYRSMYANDSGVAAPHQGVIVNGAPEAVRSTLINSRAVQAAGKVGKTVGHQVVQPGVHSVHPGGIKQPPEAAIRAALMYRLAGPRFNKDVGLMNDIKGAAHHQVPGESDERFDKLDRIGEVVIAEGGYTPKGKKDYISEIPITSQLDVASFPDAYKYPGADVYVSGPGGEPLVTDEYRYLMKYGAAGRTANSPQLGETLNAPMNDSLQKLIEEQRYSARQSGTYPQVSIATELDTFAERLNKLKDLTPEGNLHVRSRDEAAGLLAQVAKAGKAKGTKFTKFGSKDIVKDPGAASIFAKMRYSGPEMQRLANALMQMEFARTSGINQSQKDAYAQGGSYMPQKGVGSALVDLRSGIPGATTPGSHAYYNMNSPENMSDYAITDRLAFANSRNAPQFRSLTGEGSYGYDASPAEKEIALADAQRAFIGEIDGKKVPIMGDRSLPNLRFNKLGMTDAKDISIALNAQAQRRADANGKPVDTQRVTSNVRNAIAVADRHNMEQVQPPTDALGKAHQQQVRAVHEHINRPKPDFQPDRKDVFEMNYERGRQWQDERNQEERMGMGRAGIAQPPKATESKPNYTVQSLGDVQPHQMPERKDRIASIKSSLGNAYSTASSDKYKVPRRVGYGAAGAVGLAGIAGLISGERDRRNQEEQVR
jgi:hypothetical protein